MTVHMCSVPAIQLGRSRDQRQQNGRLAVVVILRVWICSPDILNRMAFMSSRKQLFLGVWFVVIAVLYYYHERGSLTVETLTDTFAQLWPAAKEKPSHEPRRTPSKPPDQPRQAPSDPGPDRRTPAPYPQDRQGVRLITKQELKKHGPNGPLSPIWLSILGQVYDVDKGKDSFYGPNGGYNFFAGRDGTRAFVSGNFTEDGLIEDIYDLSPKDCQDLKNWARDTYEKEYTFVGKLIGGFYDEHGEPTEMHHELERQVEKAKNLDVLLKEEERQFPPCNSRWNAREGGWVSCGKKSGGIVRDWEGYPRKLYSSLTKNLRCACVHKRDLDNPLLQEYPNCGPKSRECQTKPPG